MQRQEKTLITPSHLAEHLSAARSSRGLSQTGLADRSCLKRQQINYFETGTRTPSLEQLLRIARALDVPVQKLIFGGNRPGSTIRELAVELRNLGLVDLWVDSATVPCAFRRAEEVVTLAITSKAPEARIVEAIPAILAWNHWNGSLLRAFARAAGAGTVYRLAWLAEIALALERAGGFPGGCPGKDTLLAVVKQIKRPLRDRWDDLGRPAETLPRLPIWKRWRISYAADLTTFRQRAESLVSLVSAEARQLTTWEE